MAKKPKLDDVGWCQRCQRPFDRPKPGARPGSGWKVCDDCCVHGSSRHKSTRKTGKGVVLSQK